MVLFIWFKFGFIFKKYFFVTRRHVFEFVSKRANSKWLINTSVFLDCSEGGLAVSLGYVTHLLTMCSIFLQVPLRYPMKHYGSRSHIVDHISSTLSDKDRE